MTTKFVFDESSHALHRVVGTSQAWEVLSNGVRVRRRIVGPDGSFVPQAMEPWYSTLDDEFDPRRELRTILDGD